MEGDLEWGVPSRDRMWEGVRRWGPVTSTTGEEPPVLAWAAGPLLGATGGGASPCIHGVGGAEGCTGAALGEG